MYKVLFKNERSSFSPDQTSKITDYVTKEDFEQLSIVLSEINGDHGEFIYHGGTQFYMVVEGKVTFIFENKHIVLNQGDCIQILDEWHKKIGDHAKIVVISTPAFDHSLEEIR